MAGGRVPQPGDRFAHRVTGERGMVRVIATVDDDIDGVTVVVFRYVTIAPHRPVAVLPLTEFDRTYPDRVVVTLEAVR